MRYAITHGLRNSGVDPDHTEAGLTQVANVGRGLHSLQFDQIVVGTGRRFQEMHHHLLRMGLISGEVPVIHTIFCGGSEGYDHPDVVLTTGSRIPPEKYIGLASRNHGFDAWGFVDSFPGNTLFLTGGELMTALGVQQPVKGALYSIDQWGGLDRFQEKCHLVMQG